MYYERAISRDESKTFRLLMHVFFLGHSARQCFTISAHILNVQPGRKAILNVLAEKYIKCELMVCLLGIKINKIKNFNFFKIVDFYGYVQCTLYKR